MKVSVTTYSFSKLIKAGKMTQFDCIQKAKEKGIRTMTENHGQFAQDSDRVEMLINTVADERR